MCLDPTPCRCGACSRNLSLPGRVAGSTHRRQPLCEFCAVTLDAWRTLPRGLAIHPAAAVALTAWRAGR